jgi:hypothetical protein
MVACPEEGIVKISQCVCEAFASLATRMLYPAASVRRARTSTVSGGRLYAGLALARAVRTCASSAPPIAPSPSAAADAPTPASPAAAHNTIRATFRNVVMASMSDTTPNGASARLYR